MAIDLKLDTTTHDLAVEGYDLALVTDLDQIVQSLRIRLQFFFGEWYLDNTQGVKLYETVFVKNPNLRLIAAAFKATILDTPGVLSILEYNQSFTNESRSLLVSFRVNTTFGEATITEALNG